MSDQDKVSRGDAETRSTAMSPVDAALAYVEIPTLDASDPAVARYNGDKVAAALGVSAWSLYELADASSKVLADEVRRLRAELRITRLNLELETSRAWMAVGQLRELESGIEVGTRLPTEGVSVWVELEAGYCLVAHRDEDDGEWVKWVTGEEHDLESLESPVLRWWPLPSPLSAPSATPRDTIPSPAGEPTARLVEPSTPKGTL